MGFIVGFILDLLATVMGDAWMGDRRRKAHKVDCGLRVVAGDQVGLKNGWNKSRAIVHPGRLEFGRRTPTTLHVRAVVTNGQRRPQGARESWWLFDPFFQIVEVRTESATLEWAVPDDEFEWAIERVRGPEIPSA